MLELAAPMSVMWEMFLVLAAGLANWIITYIIVAGAIFDGTRERVTMKCEDVEAWCAERTDTRRIKALRCLARKGKYFVTCQLCCGVWVGFLLTPFVPGPFRSSIFGVATVLNGLVIKAIGHAILELTSVWRNRNALLEAQARLAREQRRALEAQTQALADGTLWAIVSNPATGADQGGLLIESGRR